METVLNHASLAECLFACAVVPVLIIGVKRARERCQELRVAYRVRRVLTRKRNIHRKRDGVVAELQAIDDDIFARMFRMPKRSFFELEQRVASILRARRHWTPRSEHMARVSSGCAVDSILLLASTIRLGVKSVGVASVPDIRNRWLAGGSLWDIAFMFRISYQTIHATKYLVCDSINEVLKHNILFPTSEEGLACLAAGFASIGNCYGDDVADVTNGQVVVKVGPYPTL
jgi:hypothetical protein